MNDIPPVVISGSGKYVLVAVSKDAVRVELLRGGSAFKMHKDIIASLDSELGVGYVITPEGGGVIVFTEGEHPLIQSRVKVKNTDRRLL